MAGVSVVPEDVEDKPVRTELLEGHANRLFENPAAQAALRHGGDALESQDAGHTPVPFSKRGRIALREESKSSKWPGMRAVNLGIGDERHVYPVTEVFHLIPEGVYHVP